MTREMSEPMSARELRDFIDKWERGEECVADGKLSFILSVKAYLSAREEDAKTIKELREALGKWKEYVESHRASLGPGTTAAMSRAMGRAMAATETTLAKVKE